MHSKTLLTAPSTSHVGPVAFLSSRLHVQKKFPTMGAEDFAALLQNSLTSGVMLAVAVIFALEKGQMLLVDDSIAQALLPAKDMGAFYNGHTIVLSDDLGDKTRPLLIHESMHFILKFLSGTSDPAHAVTMHQLIEASCYEDFDNALAADRHLHEKGLDQSAWRPHLHYIYDRLRVDHMSARLFGETGFNSSNPTHCATMRIEQLRCLSLALNRARQFEIYFSPMFFQMCGSSTKSIATPKLHILMQSSRAIENGVCS